MMSARLNGHNQIVKIVTVFFFLCAVCLRLLLFWSNPPENTFDDHFEPIYQILEEGAVPAKEACWECFQPPVFYVVSAVIGRVSRGLLDTNLTQESKLLQFLPCFYGILTVYVIYLILKRVRISDFARTLAFGMVCFLPRHVYMSAMHTNDTLSYFLVTLCVYLILVLIDHEFRSAEAEAAPMQFSSDQHTWRSSLNSKTLLLMISLFVTVFLALYTKSTALVLLPMIAAILAIVSARRMAAMNKRVGVYFAALLIMASAAVGSAALSDLKKYGKPLPLNIELLNVSLTQPPGQEELALFDFRPWTTIKTPILAPENVASFWTLIYSRMWFDMEPKFLQYTDPNPDWWDAYDDYLNRHDRYEWPGYLSLSPFTRLTGSTLIALGIVPLILIIVGIGRGMFGNWSLWSKTDPVEVLKVQLFVILLVANLAGIVFHTFRHPYYSFMKAAFVLNALSAFALFLALGLMWGEKYKVFRWGISVVFGFMFLLTTLHVLHIVQSQGLA